MVFGGWSSWQVITLIICISTAIGYGVVVSKKKKNN
ncbi:Uncharacterised protein [Clostridium paraputrificum]|uniref:Uncharacterized protein n=1 Tax=Clostridium paraputrificum TaxID=29363 RepID=A0A6N3FRS2_9CLOT